MITGFNHNIKYKNRVYHVQTEDSGIKNPHVITHLFVGGNIIATKKGDYRHLLGETDPAKLEVSIRALMEDQHKLMLRNLIHGKFDNAVNVDNAHHLDGPAPLNVDAAVLARTGGSGNKGTPSPQAAAPAAPAMAKPAAPVAPAPRPIAPPPPPAAERQPDLASLFGNIIGANMATTVARPTTPPPALARPAAPAPVDIPEAVPLAPEVLAARSLREKPVERPVTAETIFGEELISEKSLDEVILSYLADDSE